MNKLFATITASATASATAPAPRPAQTTTSTRCFVRDLVMDALIGVYAHERIKSQRIRLNLELDLAAPGVTGEDMAAVVKGLVSQGHVTLIETLAERIADRCLEDDRVSAARVRVEKLDVFPDAASVGVEIERARA
ncbi:dihydroneopterin aldolase [Azospirillum rugosum]|uniref:dihydroneopterin aldolase n=1 Tax=Azospirillum rugosum TaxID=416170 RepID=A0ABS4SKM8_9PROT|nr:dihydroneopterin aldolase [Azospirillum rugosum]MBP2292507.1 dihydroneopterin aldolase [Azospirillum rugosum]MDQ0526469.1 dihydroneopterin aldolase [Azospirillum rugosum]